MPRQAVALLVSVALHSVVLWAFNTERPTVAPVLGSPTLPIQLIHALGDGNADSQDESDLEGAPEGQLESARADDDIIEYTSVDADPDPRPRGPVKPGRPTSEKAAPPEASFEDIDLPPPPAPGDAIPKKPSDKPTRATDPSADEDALGDAPKTSIPLAVETDVASDFVVPEPPETAPIDQAAQQMLERRISRWAEEFSEFSGKTSETSWTEEGVDYDATVTRIPARDEQGVEEAVVKVSAVLGGRRRTTQLRVRRLAFSHFAQFVDRWDPEVQIYNDEIRGRFHSNASIFVGRDRGVQPIFHGKVTTARGVKTSGSGGPLRRREVFVGGLETRVKQIGMPRPAVRGAKRVHRLPATTRIVFSSDGSYTYQDLDPPGPPRRRKLRRGSNYLVAENDAEVCVRGVVNGEVLVFSPENIVIEGDLRYADDPTVHARSDDYLGLVSQRSVEVAPATTTGVGDLTIHAAIFAKRRFGVRGHRVPHRATLEIYGSVTTGWLSPTEPRFRTKLTFDPRLEHRRPPSFPVTTKYELVGRDGRWTTD